MADRSESEGSPHNSLRDSMGLSELKVMPFGLTNGPAILQGTNDSLFKGLKFASAYMDDIILFSRTREDHIRHVQKTIQILREGPSGSDNHS